EQLAAAAATLTARAEPGALLQRAELLRALAERLAKPSPGGMRCAALLRIDKFATLEREVGASASEEVLDEVARLLKESLHPKELVGRFGGTRLLALLERGNEQDINAWSERLLSRVQRHAMRINDKTVSVTCTIGLSVIPPAEPQLDAVLADAP
ncbi:MAG: diguanylate cyclase, partial [Gammaproteobacteria bacterium]|nr:diguanylate cyclase [Gammaproteobacteria bacterium]